MAHFERTGSLPARLALAVMAEEGHSKPIEADIELKAENAEVLSWQMVCTCLPTSLAITFSKSLQTFIQPLTSTLSVLGAIPD